MKAIKALLLILLLFIGTRYLARKTNKAHEKVEEYVKENLENIKGFNQIGIKQISIIDSNTIRSLKQSVKGFNQINANGLKNIKEYEDRYRINDSLYIAHVFLDIKDSLIYIEYPKKLTHI